ncbi:MAG: hypothetical protein MK078_04005 [Crocinitomicaceae bacterium]|nr:hypothetical protein [Crocinitomicaceae bacterium]
MLFYVGAILCIMAIVQLVRFILKARRPKAEGFIQEIVMDYYEKDKAKIKQHPHGIIKYTFKSIDYEKKLLLMRKKCKVGDKVELSVKGENPENVEMYAPKAELITSAILFAIGAIIIFMCFSMMDRYNLW